MDKLSVNESMYIGAGPFTFHIYLADGRHESNMPTDFVIHYGDESVSITTKDLWGVIKKLFGKEGDES